MQPFPDGSRAAERKASRRDDEQLHSCNKDRDIQSHNEICPKSSLLEALLYGNQISANRHRTSKALNKKERLSAHRTLTGLNAQERRWLSKGKLKEDGRVNQENLRQTVPSYIKVIFDALKGFFETRW